MSTRPIQFIFKELREMLPAVVFFAVGFNLIVLTTNLLLADYMKTFASFIVATTTALVVGKAVLVADALPFHRRFDAAPMIQPVLFKTVVYWAAVFVVLFLEKLVEYLLHGGMLMEIPEYLTAHFSWHRFVAVQIWIFVLFLLYTSAAELNARVDEGGLRQIFFSRPSTETRVKL
jgi:hypothetical protein